jgi:hypothetical protein
MPHPIGPLDRLRIERLVWALDQQLYDLPRRARIATRREVRANLLEAAADLGTTAALRRVGGSGQLAEQYLQAEYGDGPRHSWTGAAIAAGLTPLLLNFVLSEAQNAFLDGITAADPHANGTYLWNGVTWLQNSVQMTFTDGHASSTGGSWTILTFGLWLIVTVAAGRLWRLSRRKPSGSPRVRPAVD